MNASITQNENSKNESVGHLFIQARMTFKDYVTSSGSTSICIKSVFCGGFFISNNNQLVLIPNPKQVMLLPKPN